ncbi:antiporter inner membrane protein [compost metagenome]
MFAKVDVPTLGLIENMSGEVFGTSGVQAEAERLGAPYLGDLPLDGALRRAGDAGRPLVAVDPQHPASERFHHIAAQVAAALGL